MFCHSDGPSENLRLRRGEELLEFASIEPDSATFRAGIENNRAIDAAINAQ